jgi:hypothetical protein
MPTHDHFCRCRACKPPRGPAPTRERSPAGRIILAALIAGCIVAFLMAVGFY